MCHGQTLKKESEFLCGKNELREEFAEKKVEYNMHQLNRMNMIIMLNYKVLLTSVTPEFLSTNEEK